MEKQEITDKVKKIVADHFGFEIEDIKPESDFTRDLNSDSMDVIELVVDFEEVFDIDISDEKAEKINTVSEAIDCIIAAQ